VPVAQQQRRIGRHEAGAPEGEAQDGQTGREAGPRAEAEGIPAVDAAKDPPQAHQKTREAASQPHVSSSPVTVTARP
jgi:hypothetical protein